MDDLISRQAAIEVVDAIWAVTGDVNVAKAWDQIKDLPSAQIEPKWIPVTERLPEQYGNYLITYDGNVDIGTIDPNRKNVWSACDADGFYWLENVTAWMPLPEPWKGESDGIRKPD